MGREGNRKSSVGGEAEFYKSTIKKEFEPVKTPFKLSHILLSKLRSQRIISWRATSRCPLFVVGAGNQGLAICIPPYYV